MPNLRIQEVLFKDFPRDKMPWAYLEDGRAKTTAINDLTPCLILWVNEKPVAYLCYQIWTNFKEVDIHYVQTDINLQNTGYATILINEICDRYHKEFVIKAISTSKPAEKLLQKCGFERSDPGTGNWLLLKEKVK